MSRLKLMAQVDIAERGRKIKFRLPDREIEMRVATIPTAGIGMKTLFSACCLPAQLPEFPAETICNTSAA